MARYLLVSLVVMILDQLSKHWMVVHFREFEVLRVWPVFNLTLVYNRGAAFSFLAGADGWQQYLFIGLATAISAGLCLWIWRLDPHRRLEAWGLSLILGGAVGNLADRLMLGKVVDFLQWHWKEHYFPSFNLADSAITLGVALLLLEWVLEQRRRGA